MKSDAMKRYQAITSAVRKEITAAVGPDNVCREGPQSGGCGRNASYARGYPEMTVRVQRLEQIQRLLHIAHGHPFPVISRGAGTGLTGGCMTTCGGVLLSLAEMNRIHSIDPVDMIAEVEPGVITRDLREAAELRRLYYPPDPAALDQSTVGGNAATNAAGPACVKYGSTQNFILGLEAVLPGGEVIHTGVKTRKGVVGYDLTRLLAGSEGTLAVITGLTLRLIPRPAAVAGLAVFYENAYDAMAAVCTVMGGGSLPSAVAWMDHNSLQHIGDQLPFKVSGAQTCLAIFELDGSAAQITAEIEDSKALFREHGAAAVLPVVNACERSRLWALYRRAALRVKESADVAVPIGRIAELTEALPAIEARYALNIFTVGHAGDGDMHLRLSVAGADCPRRIESCLREIFERVSALDGTFAGGHGMGAAGRRLLPTALSAENIRLHRGIKAIFDPNRILNPDRIFFDETSDAGQGPAGRFNP